MSGILEDWAKQVHADLQKECDTRLDAVKFSDDPAEDLILRQVAKTIWMHREVNACIGIISQ